MKRRITAQLGKATHGGCAMFSLSKLFRKTPPADVESVWLGRSTLVYHLGGRQMSITVDSDLGETTVFAETIGRWDDDPSLRIDETSRTNILAKVKKELESRGIAVRVMH